MSLYHNVWILIAESETVNLGKKLVPALKSPIMFHNFNRFINFIGFPCILVSEIWVLTLGAIISRSIQSVLK